LLRSKRAPAWAAGLEVFFAKRIIPSICGDATI
jgi:hypothetical protein